MFNYAFSATKNVKVDAARYLNIFDLFKFLDLSYKFKFELRGSKYLKQKNIAQDHNFQIKIRTRTLMAMILSSAASLSSAENNGIAI